MSINAKRRPTSRSDAPWIIWTHNWGASLYHNSCTRWDTRRNAFMKKGGDMNINMSLRTVRKRQIYFIVLKQIIRTMQYFSFNDDSICKSLYMGQQHSINCLLPIAGRPIPISFQCWRSIGKEPYFLYPQWYIH